MESRYNPASIEQKWQSSWTEQSLDQTPEDSDRPKFYALSMFPYPSGNLHMGHVRVYAITDAIARLKRMQGYRVLNPMGWDAFGLPAENAAIERGVHPAKWTYQNIAHMKGQLQRLGISFDWNRELATCSPDYYKWTQWIFLQFFQAGLAYQREAAVNWDPIDQTVLANEQVDNEGRSWRSGAKVERKLLRQWFLKITDYAEQLLNDLDKLTGWPERVKLMQANWIGKSTGAYLEFPIVGMDEKIAVYTTRPDTVYGLTYVVLSPEHPLTPKVTASDRTSAVEAFIKEVSTQSELERTAEDKPKRGIPTGGKAINPFTGEEIPIWIADYVLYEYGTGAVMGVPAHDVRDFQFAKENHLPIKGVILPDSINLKGFITEAAKNHVQDELKKEFPQKKFEFVALPIRERKQLISDKAKEERAYLISQRSENQHKTPHENWFQAEEELAGELLESFVIVSIGMIDISQLISDKAKEKRAYLISQRSENQHKTPDENWFQAEEELVREFLENDSVVFLNDAYTDPGIMVNSAQFNGTPSTDGKLAIIQYAEKAGFGKARVQYRLRDWLISRQRYWGAPIPVIHCPNCGTVPVPDKDLPVLLPEDVQFSGRGASPLAKLEKWLNVPCPSCGTPAKRETDTMDTFIDSSWYFLRYPDAKNDQQAFDPAKINTWMPVDQYVGGIEHAILHLLYSRFFVKVLRDKGLLNFDEPFQRLLTQGMVQGLTYKNTTTGKYVPSTQIQDTANPKDPQTGEPLQVFYEKMSKSKYNGVDPLEVLGKYGADTARLFVLFKAPPEKDLEWDDADVEGQSRFLNRIWRLIGEFSDRTAGKPPAKAKAELSKPEKDLRYRIHNAIQAVTEDLEGEYQFNTAISELMKLSNALTDASCKDSLVYAEGIETLILLLAPFAPHIAEELWHGINRADSVHLQSWPKVDPSALVVDEITLVIQINGKTRGTIQAPADADKASLEAYARNSEVARRHIEGKEIKKAIVVPGKLVNFVIG